MSWRKIRMEFDEPEQGDQPPDPSGGASQSNEIGWDFETSLIPSDSGTNLEKRAKKGTRWSEDLNQVKFIQPAAQDDPLPGIPRVIETTDIGNTLLPLLRKQSMSRLEEIELKQLDTEKPEPEKRLSSVSSLKTDLSRLSAALQRQLSEFNLSQGRRASLPVAAFENVQHQANIHLRNASMSEDDEPNAFCKFPGSPLGKGCHTVAATVLAQGKPELHLSSSSSSDDLYESTRYSKDVLQEKLRSPEGLDVTRETFQPEIEHEIPQKTPVKKRSCSCRSRERHKKCFIKRKHAPECEAATAAQELSLDSSKPETKLPVGAVLHDSKTACTRETCKSQGGKQIKSLKHISNTFTSLRYSMKSSHACKAKMLKKQKKLLCQCHTHGVDVKNSDFHPSRQGKKTLSLNKPTSKSMHSCGGFHYEDAQCCCNFCNVIDKPWDRLAGGRQNALVDIPYRLTNADLKRREQKAVELKKSLGDQISTLADFCSRATCENAVETSTKPVKNETLEKMKRRCPKAGDNQNIGDFHDTEPAKLGYFLEVNDDRITRGEHFTDVQLMVEKVVHCQWRQDLASLKVRHFLNNLPERRSCFQKPNSSRSDGRTCYNPKLIERLADVVQFNTSADRRIHELSTIPKFVKFQEPQLICGPETAMPEIKTLLEEAKLPTIYRDLFKSNKRELRKLMDAVIPPLQWLNETGLWEMKVSLEPDKPEENQTRMKQIESNEAVCHAVNKRFCAGRYRLYFEVFAEVIRQELLECPERAFLMGKIREEFLTNLLILDGGLEISLASAYEAADDPSVYEERRLHLERLNEEILSLNLEIESMKALVWNLEKWTEDQGVVRDYLHDDAEKHWKKTNHQLEAQFEAIQAGLLYDLD